MALMGEYLAIQKYYGNRTANRSKVLLMNHIDEGLRILHSLGASDKAMRAFCIHPLVQMEVEVDLSWSRALPLAQEYARKANAYLCSTATDWVKTVKDVKRLVGSMSKDCMHMLIADKQQNQKDFRAFHQETHERAIQLEAYFILWLKYLNTLHKRNRPTISVRAILVRDFNWRMGNLRRWYHGIGCFDPGIELTISMLIQLQMVREKERHELRLWGEMMNLPDFDWVHARARGQAMRNRAERFFWDSEERDQQNPVA